MANLAKVKSVISGDSLSLKSPKSGAEKTLSLAYVSAPRLKREGDEVRLFLRCFFFSESDGRSHVANTLAQPYAFESRDFLRKLVVGKEIKFTVLYQVPNTSHEYGMVTLSTGQSLVELALAEGMVKLRDDAGRRNDQPEGEALLEQLRVLESNARMEAKGMWSTTEDGRIESRYENPSDPLEFLEKHKGKPINCKTL